MASLVDGFQAFDFSASTRRDKVSHANRVARTQEMIEQLSSQHYEQLLQGAAKVYLSSKDFDSGLLSEHTGIPATAFQLPNEGTLIAAMEKVQLMYDPYSKAPVALRNEMSKFAGVIGWFRLGMAVFRTGGTLLRQQLELLRSEDKTHDLVSKAFAAKFDAYKTAFEGGAWQVLIVGQGQTTRSNGTLREMFCLAATAGTKPTSGNEFISLKNDKKAPIAKPDTLTAKNVKLKVLFEDVVEVKTRFDNWQKLVLKEDRLFDAEAVAGSSDFVPVVVNGDGVEADTLDKLAEFVLAGNAAVAFDHA
jgi:hypothetical protein